MRYAIYLRSDLYREKARGSSDTRENREAEECAYIQRADAMMMCYRNLPESVFYWKI